MELETRNSKPENRFSPAISVIVPIYNMEKLMRKCLDSILAQTFQDYECLLIDDGSKPVITGWLEPKENTLSSLILTIGWMRIA